MRVYETYNHAGSVYMISEYVEGDFVLKQGQRDEETAAKLVGQLLSAVRYLHDRNIVHGDLQSNHIIVSSPGNTLTVVGFASSRHYHESGHAPSGPTNQKTTHTFFAAPETVKSGTITPKSDLWSVGVIAHALVIGSLPFKRAHDFNQFVCSPSGGGKLDFSGFEWDSISDEAREFLQSLVEVDPAQRLDSHEAQRNAWIKNYYKKPSEKDIDRDLLKRVAKHFKQRVRKDSLFRKAALMVSSCTNNAEW